MAIVFIAGNNWINTANSFWNSNDTYVVSGGDRGFHPASGLINQKFNDLLSKFDVDILLEQYSANNYSAHIGDFDDEEVADGSGVCLYTCVFEVSPKVGDYGRITRDKAKVQPMPEMQG